MEIEILKIGLSELSSPSKTQMDIEDLKEYLNKKDWNWRVEKVELSEL